MLKFMTVQLEKDGKVAGESLFSLKRTWQHSLGLLVATDGTACDGDGAEVRP